MTKPGMVKWCPSTGLDGSSEGGFHTHSGVSVFVEFDTGKLDFGMTKWDDKQVRLLEEPLNEGLVNSRLVVKDEDYNQYDLVMMKQLAYQVQGHLGASGRS